MLVAQRYQQIVQVVNEKGSIRVNELSDMFGVTQETIRRDLDYLEKEDKLRRSHGGAVSIIEEPQEVPYFEREMMNMTEKRHIASKAIAFVEENDRLVIDASSTAFCLAKALPNIPLTVLTNSIKVTIELSTKDQIDVMTTGGRLTSRSLSYVGPMAEKALDDFHVSKCFISCKGVHVDHGLSESNEMQARIKQKMMNMADGVYLLADYSKFGTQAFTQFSTWDKVDVLITDERTQASQLKVLEQFPLRIFT